MTDEQPEPQQLTALEAPPTILVVNTAPPTGAAVASTTPRGRPTEFASVIAGAAAYVLCRALHVTDTEVVADVTLLLGFLPAAVTWLVVTFTHRN